MRYQLEDATPVAPEAAQTAADPKPATKPTAAKKPIKRPTKTGYGKAKKKPAPKPAPNPKTKPAPRARPAAKDAKIVWLNKPNPFRVGGGPHARTEHLKRHNGKTVEQFVAAGGRRGTVRTCVRLGLVKLT